MTAVASPPPAAPPAPPQVPPAGHGSPRQHSDFADVLDRLPRAEVKDNASAAKQKGTGPEASDPPKPPAGAEDWAALLALSQPAAGKPPTERAPETAKEPLGQSLANASPLKAPPTAPPPASPAVAAKLVAARAFLAPSGGFGRFWRRPSRRTRFLPRPRLIIKVKLRSRNKPQARLDRRRRRRRRRFSRNSRRRRRSRRRSRRQDRHGLQPQERSGPLRSQRQDHFRDPRRRPNRAPRENCSRRLRQKNRRLSPRPRQPFHPIRAPTSQPASKGFRTRSLTWPRPNGRYPRPRTRRPLLRTLRSRRRRRPRPRQLDARRTPRSGRSTSISRRAAWRTCP